MWQFHRTPALPSGPARLSIRSSAAAIALAVLGAGSAAQNQIAHLYAVPDGQQEVPPTFSPGAGAACFDVDTVGLTLSYYIEFSGLTAPETAAHIHGFAGPGTNAPILFPLPLGSPISGTISLTPSEAQGILDGLTYVNIHTSNFPNGEIRGQIVGAPPQIRYCFGDGTSGACPCANNSAPGAGEGCVNTTGAGGRLGGSGFASIHCDSLLLAASQMPSSSTAIYLQGNASIAPTSFGDGLRCIGGSLRRLAVVTNSFGNSHIPNPGTPGVASLGSITQPGTYFYQTYYRDPDFGFCPKPPGNTWNITNGLQLTWVP